MQTLTILSRAAIIIATLSVGAAQASDFLLMQLPPVKGESRLKDYKDWSEISSLQWGAGAPSSFDTGRLTTGKAIASGITWSQVMDSTYPQLMTSLLDTKGVAAEFRVVRPGGGPTLPAPYLSLKTGTTLVDGVGFSNNEVTASTTFGSITLEWNPVGLGDKAPAVSTTWDIAKGTAELKGSLKPTVPLTSSAPAGTPGETRMYLRLGSGSSAIAGTSPSDGYENWIEIDSAQFGAGRAVSITGGGGPASLGKPSFSELSWTQSADATLPVVLEQMVRGRLLNEATLEYVTVVGSGSKQRAMTTMQMVMRDVAFTGLSISASEDGVFASESMAFSSFSQKFWSIDEMGLRTSPPVEFAYDVLKGTTRPAFGPIATANFGAGNLENVDLAASSQVNLPPAAAPIPEPEQWALLLAGMGLVASIARRRAARP